MATGSAGKSISEIKDATIAQIDIESEYRSVGLRIPDRAIARESGWLAAYAIDRTDRKPSAAINLLTGYYRDLGGAGRTLSFWDFMAEFGPFREWFDALKHFAEKAGVKLKTKRPARSAFEQVRELRLPSWMDVRHLLAKYPGTRLEDYLRCGCRLSRYPDLSRYPAYVLSWPVYGPSLTAAPHRGYVIESANGAPFEDENGELLKRRSIGSGSGLLNHHALQCILSGKAEIVIKTEGPSDMMALLAMVPEEDRDRIVVTTNACGTHETSLPREMAETWKSIDLVIIHDADEPGQQGAKLWASNASPYAKRVINLQLPFEVQPNHGKDIRDWIAEGGTWPQLLRMIEETEPSGGIGDDTVSAETTLLNRLGIVVHGHLPNGHVVIFDDQRRRVELDMERFRIGNLEKLVSGETIDREVDRGDDDEADPTRITIPQIVSAINRQAYHYRIHSEKMLSSGIWKTGPDRLTLVQESEVSHFNGTQQLEPWDRPICDKLQFEMDGELSVHWFNRKRLTDRIEDAKADPEWCRNVLEEARSIFARWDNWKHADSPLMLAALVIASWFQSVWPIRPMVAISGSTNTGKSTLFEECLAHLFGEMAWANASASEAAIRQAVRNSSRIIMLDEFEASETRDKILKALRRTTRGQKGALGTPGQKAIEFSFQHIAWLSAKELGLKEAADVNRFITFELKRLPLGRASTLSVPKKSELNRLGIDLMIIGLLHWRSVLDMQEELQSRAWGKYDRRLAQITSIPAAIIASIQGSGVEGAIKIAEQSLSLRHDDTVIETDDKILIDDIRKARLYPIDKRRSGGITIGEALAEAFISESRTWTPDVEKALSRVGIRIIRNEQFELNIPGAFIFFHPGTVATEILSQTSGHRDIGLLFKRLEGSESRRLIINGQQSRGIAVPAELILSGPDPQFDSVF